MQAGLLQLEQAPDFQRAAALAQQASDVPVPYRQQQFLRFRSSLGQHFTRRLAAGEDEVRLRTSLLQLVQALGMADFEAEYLESEVRRRLPGPNSVPVETYEDRLRTLQTTHVQRMETIQSLTGLDEELRDQLIETEQNRHREALLAAGNQTQRT
jgi:hypothetical protein